MSAADRAADLDVATAETRLPIAPTAVAAFLGDVERLLRLNPLLAIERWEREDGGFHLVAHNESNGCVLDVSLQVEPAVDGLTLHYGGGLKRSTRLTAEPAPEGTRLVVTEHYPRIVDPQDPRVAEVDKSLVPWVAAIRRHLLARRRWGWLPGWRWYCLPGPRPAAGCRGLGLHR